MKKLILALAMIATSAASAAPVIAGNVTQTIKELQDRYHTSYVRMVMPGVLYRGGSTQGNEKAHLPLNNDSLNRLCEDGFDAVVYGYGNNFGGPKTGSCSKGTISYVSKRWDHPNEIHDVMVELHNIIVEGKGAMYVHCWYGVHASGTLAATALRQFCGLSGDQAVKYWESTVPSSKLWYPNVISAIKAFKPDPSLNISPDQQARVCPNL